MRMRRVAKIQRNRLETQCVQFQKTILLLDSASAYFEIQKLLLLLQSFLNTVRLVQLVEHQIVVLGVVGSSPTSHPKTGPLESRSFLLSNLKKINSFRFE